MILLRKHGGICDLIMKLDSTVPCRYQSRYNFIRRLCFNVSARQVSVMVRVTCDIKIKLES